MHPASLALPYAWRFVVFLADLLVALSDKEAAARLRVLGRACHHRATASNWPALLLTTYSQASSTPTRNQSVLPLRRPVTFEPRLLYRRKAWPRYLHSTSYNTSQSLNLDLDCSPWSHTKMANG